MGFGTYLENAYESASSTVKEGFDTATQATSDTGHYIKQEAIVAKDKVVEGATYAKDKVVEGATYTKDKVVEGATYTKGKIVDGVEYVSDKVIEAKEKVDEYLDPKPAGSKIIYCSNKSKAQRVAERQNKIERAKNKLKSMQLSPERATLDRATTRFEFNNSAVERARLADNAYNIGQGDPPEGWKRVSLDEIKELGLNKDDFSQYAPDFNPEEYEDGFFVDFYKTDSDIFGEEKYVLSYRGTEGFKDWTANAKQGFGQETEHYNRAIIIAQKAQEKLKDKLEVTGHSLGGGLATAAGIISGSKTYAFNPAGVHPATLERAGEYSRDDAYNQVNGKPLVDNIVILGELLTAIQNPTLQHGVIGVAIYNVPVISGVALSQDRAFTEQGTLSYGMAGVRHDVPLLGNAQEVASATAKGESIQGMTPSKMGEVNATINPLRKKQMHPMYNIIAGIEQQKADDMNIINEQVF